MNNTKYFEDPTEKFVQIPNDFFDELMPILPPAAFKIICLIYRKTRGWHKDIDRISISQIVKGTGIKSDRTVRSALKYLNEEGFISIYEDGSQTLSYGLNMLGKNYPGKNYRSTPVKITAVEAKTPVKITDTKDILSKDINTQSENSKSEKLNNLADKIAELSHTDIDTIGPKTREALKQLALALYKKPKIYTQLVKYVKWWYANDWRGKQGQPPTVFHIGDTWGQFEASTQPKQSTYTGPPLSPEQKARLDELTALNAQK
jgi:SOS-response transcriptional repressor LexA